MLIKKKKQLLLPLGNLNCQWFPCCFQFGNPYCCLLHLTNHRPQQYMVNESLRGSTWYDLFNRKFITMNTIEQFFVVKHLMILKQKRNVPVVAMSHHDREEQKWFYEAVVDCSNKRRQILSNSIPKSRKPSLENVFPWISFCFLQILVCSVYTR